jgi:hypothetical protein
MPFNEERAAQYVEAVPALEAWYRNAADETTAIGVDHTGIRGVWDIASFAPFSGFKTWHALLLQSVEGYWEMREYPALPRSQAYRMFDSFINWLRTRADGRPVLAQAIFEHGHIIVNGPTLDALHRVCTTFPFGRRR